MPKQPTPAKDFLNKVDRKWQYLLSKNKSAKAKNMSFILKVNQLHIWLTAWPNVTESQCLNYIKHKYELLSELIPGPSDTCHNKWQQELHTFINQP